jgi:hypothetical protein
MLALPITLTVTLTKRLQMTHRITMNDVAREAQVSIIRMMGEKKIHAQDDGY